MLQESLLVAPSEVILTFQGSVSVSSMWGQAVQNCLTLEDGTHTLPQNAGYQIPNYTTL